MRSPWSVLPSIGDAGGVHLPVCPGLRWATVSIRWAQGAFAPGFLPFCSGFRHPSAQRAALWLCPWRNVHHFLGWASRRRMAQPCARSIPAVGRPAMRTARRPSKRVIGHAHFCFSPFRPPATGGGGAIALRCAGVVCPEPPVRAGLLPTGRIRAPVALKRRKPSAGSNRMGPTSSPASENRRSSRKSGAAREILSTRCCSRWRGFPISSATSGQRSSLP